MGKSKIVIVQKSLLLVIYSTTVSNLHYLGVFNDLGFRV